MRIRHALATAAVGTALSIGALSAPAQAATTDSHTAATAAATAVSASTDQTNGGFSPQTAYHFWASYWDGGDCLAAGERVIESNPSRYLKAKCDFGSNGKYNLYILI